MVQVVGVNFVPTRKSVLGEPSSFGASFICESLEKKGVPSEVLSQGLKAKKI